MDTYGHNGRIDLLHRENATSYNFFEEKNSFQDFADRSSQNIIAETPLADLFFSDLNVNALHEGIRYTVYSKSSQQIVLDRQSDTELRVIMRSIYLQYAKHLEDSVVEQVRDLNKMVLDFAVGRVITEVDQFVNYRNDVSKLPVPLEPAKNMSSAGQKILHTKIL
jgi:hypothetical protein